MPRDDDAPDLQPEETCRQCPTQTLRSRCPHTVEGRQYLKQNRHPRQSTPESSNSFRPPWFNYWSPTKSSGNPGPPHYNYSCPGPVPGPAYGMPEIQSQLINAPGLIYAPPLALVSSQLISLPPTHGNSDATIDLVSLNGASVAPSTTLSTATSSSPARGADCSDVDDEETPRASRAASKQRRTRITKKNILYGNVDGAMRGSKPYDILRMKELRPPITGQAEASARFLRCASDIIERCEHLSQETGCWLHFSAQHLFAHGGFLHYTSPRLLREAKKDAEQIINHANRVYATLIAARNEESKEMHKRLLLAEGDKEAAQEAERSALLQAETARRERDLQSEEIEAQRLELQALKAKLRLAEKRNNPLQVPRV